MKTTCFNWFLQKIEIIIHAKIESYIKLRFEKKSVDNFKSVVPNMFWFLPKIWY